MQAIIKTPSGEIVTYTVVKALSGENYNGKPVVTLVFENGNHLPVDKNRVIEMMDEDTY